MTRILIEEEAYTRLANQLQAIDATLTFIRMKSDGQLYLDGVPITIETAKPEVAWLNVGLVRANLSQHYVQTVLASGTVKWLQTYNAGENTPLRGDLLFLDNLGRYLAHEPLRNEAT